MEVNSADLTSANDAPSCWKMQNLAARFAPLAV
jgi:hypothetical protein